MAHKWVEDQEHIHYRGMTIRVTPQFPRRVDALKVRWNVMVIDRRSGQPLRRLDTVKSSRKAAIWAGFVCIDNFEDAREEAQGDGEG